MATIRGLPMPGLGATAAHGPGRKEAKRTGHGPGPLARPASNLSQSWVSFAGEVVRQLRAVAHELAKSPGAKAFCSALAAALADIQQQLEDLGGSPADAAGERRVQKLLDNLEKLCQWPAAPIPSPSGNAFDPRRYPTLALVLSKRSAVEKGIRLFATDARASASRMKLIKFLKGYCKPAKAAPGPDLSDLAPPGQSREEQEDYQAYIKALYASLSCCCLCPMQDGHQGITTNLRLRGCCTPREADESMEFRLFFLDHPHQYGSHDVCQWQEAQICVSRRRGVGFQDDPASTTQDPSRQGRPVSVGNFCKLITNRQRAQLKLAVSEGGLFWEGSGPLSQAFHLHESTIKLSELLSAAKLSRKMKLLLSYFLAKSVWQFYESEWMKEPWTKERVHFMFERRSKTPKGIFINEPFLCAQFDHSSGGEESAVHHDYRSHLFPKILSLGIMFLEIELGIKIEDYRPPGSVGPDGKPTVNADHFAAMEVFDQTELWDDAETFAAFKNVIGVCLIPDSFKPHLHDPGAVRSAFQEKVVNPLRLLYKSAWEMPDTSEIRAIDLSIQRSTNLNRTAAVERSRPISPAPLPFDPMATGAQYPFTLPAPHPSLWAYHTPFLHPGMQLPPSPTPTPQRLPDGIMSSSSAFTSDTWFERLDIFNTVLRAKPKDKDARYQPARVAVLDTGVSDDYTESVKAYKDFVAGEDDVWQDNTGHGTNAVRLVQKVYNMAEIYVGRVFERAEATSSTPALLADAIRHATSDWKVDVVILASGFDLAYAEITNAIEEANKAHVLIFAAAANYGNLAEIAFPGRLYVSQKVVCMFSTDAHARSSPNFNPSASPGARYNFAVLGENITLPSLENPVSGTSFATMIGAALAARLLDFARHKDVRDRLRSADRLNTVEGISAVFFEMARSTVDNNYHCMAPWKLIPRPTGAGEEEPSARRLRERAHVCETISRALEGMYGG
ncbi:hypothetical protein GQ53DRAFT_712148 [Thozetella sp. PMI_491]|nr:hypothetical protein GQ53DRAFT_712148 [Thozetella sp. PMI_491]